MVLLQHQVAQGLPQEEAEGHATSDPDNLVSSNRGDRDVNITSLRKNVLAPPHSLFAEIKKDILNISAASTTAAALLLSDYDGARGQGIRDFEQRYGS